MSDVVSSSTPLSLSRSALDRAADERTDPVVLERALADPATRVLDLYGDRVPFEADPAHPRLVYRAPREGDAEGLLLWLGRDGEQAYLAVVQPGEGDQQHQLGTLRTLGLTLSDRDVGVLTTAVGVANWHANHGYCPRCGSPSTPDRGGWTRVCQAEGTVAFPRTDPAVIMAVLSPDDRLLLARGPQWPPGRLSVLAGFVEPGESLEAAVAREVAEEVGLRVTDVRYHGNQPWPFPASLMVGFFARALDTELRPDTVEIVEARWLSREELLHELEADTLAVPPRLSIARHLIEHWLAVPLAQP